MEILQTLVIDKNTLVFTKHPQQDLLEAQELYRNEDREAYMGYELPHLVDFEFLGEKHKAISFWHDNEDIREIDLPN